MVITPIVRRAEATPAVKKAGIKIAVHLAAAVAEVLVARQPYRRAPVTDRVELQPDMRVERGGRAPLSHAPQWEKGEGKWEK